MYEHVNDVSTFFATLQCLNYDKFPGDIGKVALSRRCVETNKLDWWESGVGRCIQGRKAHQDDGKKAAKREKLGREARRLMLANVARTEKRGVIRSCTMEIATTLKKDRRVCVVDEGVWKGCDVGAFDCDWRSGAEVLRTATQQLILSESSKKNGKPCSRQRIRHRGAEIPFLCLISSYKGIDGCSGWVRFLAPAYVVSLSRHSQPSPVEVRLPEAGHSIIISAVHTAMSREDRPSSRSQRLGSADRALDNFAKYSDVYRGEVVRKWMTLRRAGLKM